MYYDIITVGLLCLVSLATSQRPPYGSQFFYLNPNNVANSNHPPQYQSTRQWFQPAGQMRYMPDTADPTQQLAAVEDDDDDDEAEAMQFHSQDGAGSFAFGYSMPDQVRIESRTLDGTVRGSYSYLDPTGRTIKVQYWDDGAGFHSSGNNVPENVPEPVQDTPEVQAARDEHFRAYQQVLERNAAYADYLAERRRKEQGTFDEDVYTLTDKHQNLHPEEEDYDDAGVSVESENHSNTPVDGKGVELSRYPKLQIPQNLFDPSQVHDPKLEAVIVENPEILGPSLDGNSVRSGKSSPMPVSENLQGPLSGAPLRKGFSYSFQHTIPMYVEVKTVMDDSDSEKYARSRGGGPQGRLGPEADDLRSAIAKLVNSPVSTISQRATDLGRIPIAAVHDAQVAPYQRDGLKNHQTLPVHHEDGNVPQVTPYQHDGSTHPQTSPLHSENGNGGSTYHDGAVVGDSGAPSTRLLPPLSVSQRAAYFGAIPVAAVHDAQVSPKQRDGLRNHQLLPVYIQHGGEEN